MEQLTLFWSRPDMIILILPWGGHGIISIQGHILACNIMENIALKRNLTNM